MNLTSGRRLRWLSVPVSVLLLLALAGSGRLVSQPSVSRAPNKQGSAPKAAESLPAAQKREAYTVAPADIPHTILINGELRAERSREITVPRIRSGFASTVTYMALEGTQVKQGERILEFDASNLLSQKSEAERRLDEAKLKIEKSKAELEAQRMDFQMELGQTEGNLKVAELYGKIGKELLPANTYQKYQLDLEKAVLARDKAKEKLNNHLASVPAQLKLVAVERDQAEIDLKKIDGDLAMLQVDAPQDGIVIYGDNWASNRKVQVGDSIFPGMPVLILPDLSSMQVVGFVYDTELRNLSPGMVCDLHLDAVPGKTWRGKIVSLTSVASRKSFASQHKVFRVVIQPDSVDLNLMKPGMTVRIEVPVSLAAGVVAIPREYLGVDTKGRYYVVKGTDPKTATAQIVQVGVFSSSLVQIASGLNAGDRILAMQDAKGVKP